MPDVFSRLRHFFRNPAENFAGLRSGTFFRPKEDPGMEPGHMDQTGRQFSSTTQCFLGSMHEFHVNLVNLSGCMVYFYSFQER